MTHDNIRAVGTAIAFAVMTGCGHSDPTPPTGGAGGAGGTGTGAAGDGGGGSGADAAADAPLCGDWQQACCADNICKDGLACDGYVLFPSSMRRCVHCGDQNEPCCVKGAECADGFSCHVSVDTGRRCYAVPDSAPPCITSCQQPGGDYCGTIGDNCGHTLDCGSCINPGFTCGGAGIVGLCGASPDAGACALTICQTPAGQYCGSVGDGCGGSIGCGNCRDGTACDETHVCGGSDSGPRRDPPPPLPPPPPPPPFGP